jgi:putative cardiolipin synthase
MALLACGVLLLAYLNVLPSLDDRRVSAVLRDTGGTHLGKAISARTQVHPALCGIHALAAARDAFAARLHLANVAERSLDVQYYIWRDDMSGTLLFDALRRAADRGVRVRLLLDDNNTSGLDATLAALDAQPNIEVRLFNPFAIRSARWLGFVTAFPRLNRRMHNKSFTADNQATIIGGRNVGDEYFDAAETVAFIDMDVLAIGPIVDDVSRDFDRYWASESSYPVDKLLPRVDASRISGLESAVTGIERSPAATAYLTAVRESSFVGELVRGTLPLEWAPARMVSDDPAKALGRGAPEASVSTRLKSFLGEPADHLELVSPYFVPTAAGVEWFVDIAGRGTQIRVLTNSLEATDVAAVHAGYAKRRKPLLQAGVALFEVRRQSARSSAMSRAAASGSSDSSLHAKTFSVDGARIFIGSFNFDPRSARLNTEMGFIIDSANLAQQIDAAFDSSVRADAYEVRLSDAGELYWLERRGTQLRRYDIEPGSSFWSRAVIGLLSVLPVEWLL